MKAHTSMRRVALRVVAVSVLLVVTAACSGSDDKGAEGDTAKSGGGATTDEVVVIGTTGDFPPYESRDESGEYVGLIPDLVEAVFAELDGYDYKWEPMQFTGLGPALESGRIDMITALYANEERRAAFDLMPVLQVPLATLALAERAEEINGWEDLCGKTSGVLVGSPILGSVVEENSESACTSQGRPAIKTSGYPSLAQELEDLVAKRIDVSFEDEVIFSHIQATRDEFAIAFVTDSIQEFVWAVGKGSPLGDVIGPAIQDFLATDAAAELLEEWGIEHDLWDRR